MTRHPLVEALAVTGRLPRAELAAAIENLADATPDLLAAVARAAEAGVDDAAESNLVFFALHILAWAREPRLHAPLMRLLRRPEAEIDELLGDAETEGLGSIVAGAFDGHAEDLFDLACEPERNEFLRGSVMSAIAFLTWDGRIDAVATRGFLARFNADRVIEAGDNGWYAWSEIVEQLGWTDLVPLVEQAYADGRVWDGMASVEDFHNGLAKTLQAVPDDATRFRHGEGAYFTDVLEELGRWRFDIREPAPLPPPSLPKPPSWREPTGSRQGAETARNPMRHVGRNDPCPCGSGKKYKKCCLATQ